MKQKNVSLVNYQLKEAELITMTKLRVKIEGTTDVIDKTWSLQTKSRNIALTISKVVDHQVELLLEEPFPFHEDCFVCLENERCYVKVTDVVRTKAFDVHFYYEGNDLGSTYQQAHTSFAIWAPTATKMELVCFDHWYDERGTHYPCLRDDKGVWRVKVEGDLECKWYVYQVYRQLEWCEVIDPYARFLSINGQKAMVGDLTKTEPAHWSELLPLTSLNETIIYEVHVRDVSISPSSGINQKGRYLGLTETGTKTRAQQKSGLDYIVDLGVTHVELLPVLEFASVDESERDHHYNWGYDTDHFFVPEGSYASDPYDGYSRVRELKALISSFHDKQLRVILDVVFNHLYIIEHSSLEKLVPGYFFRYTADGKLSNGTGVGNDFASERKMARKLIVDAVRYILREYRVDGLRFDLMGILDTETIKTIIKIAKELNPQIFLLGEGWDLPTAYPASKRVILTNAKNKSLEGVSFFQDQFRDYLKGSTFDLAAPGFISGASHNQEALINGIKGSPAHFSKPVQAIHYVEAHDNHTLWDKLRNIHKDEDLEWTRKRQRLATTIVLLSQGIPFLHAGQEFYRTKYNVGNSYSSPDCINQLNWDQKDLFIQDVEYVRAIIEIRRKHPAFRLETFEQIEQHFHLLKNGGNLLAYKLKEVGLYDTWNDILIIHNASEKRQLLPLQNAQEWQVVVDDQDASLVPLYRLGKDCVPVSPLSTVVCMK